MEFHEKLQTLRRQMGLTQEELAEALFVSRSAVSKWESGRGYPSIDSLKAIAKLYAVTVDELLSSEQALEIAQEEQKQKENSLCDLLFGLLDGSTAMFFFLPFFGQQGQAMIQGVSLTGLTGVSSWVKIAYILTVAGLSLWGTVTLALQNCQQTAWIRNKRRISLLLHASATLLFIISSQPYAATFLFLLLGIKGLILGKRR